MNPPKAYTQASRLTSHLKWGNVPPHVFVFKSFAINANVLFPHFKSIYIATVKHHVATLMGKHTSIVCQFGIKAKNPFSNLLAWVWWVKKTKSNMKPRMVRYQLIMKLLILMIWNRIKWFRLMLPASNQRMKSGGIPSYFKLWLILRIRLITVLLIAGVKWMCQQPRLITFQPNHIHVHGPC